MNNTVFTERTLKFWRNVVANLTPEGLEELRQHWGPEIAMLLAQRDLANDNNENSSQEAARTPHFSSMRCGA